MTLDSNKLLKKLSSIVDDNTDRENGGSKSWISTVIIFFVVLIGIVVFAWVANKNAKELAKLRHEKNKEKIERDNLKVEHEAAKNSEEKESIQKGLTVVAHKIDELDKEITAAEKAHRKNIETINSITSWRDI